MRSVALRAGSGSAPSECHGALKEVWCSLHRAGLPQVAPEIISNADFTKALAASLHRPAVIPAPAFALNLVLGSERASVLLEGQVRRRRE